MTYLNDQPDFEEDGAELYCDNCGEELLADGSCPMCDYDDDYDDDDDDDDDDDPDPESDDITIEALIDMEDHLDE